MAPYHFIRNLYPYHTNISIEKQGECLNRVGWVGENKPWNADADNIKPRHYFSRDDIM